MTVVPDKVRAVARRGTRDNNAMDKHPGSGDCSASGNA